MTGLLILILILIPASVGTVSFMRYASYWYAMDAERLAALDRHSRAFFRASDELLSADELPDDLAQAIGGLSRALAHEEIASSYCRTFYNHRVELFSKSDEISDASRAFIESASHRKLILEAMVHGLLAITFRSRRRGPLVRQIIADYILDPKRTVPAAVSANRMMREKMPPDECLVAA